MGTGDWHNSSTGLCAEAGSRKQQAEFLCLAFLHSIPVTLSCLPSSLWLPQTPSSGKPNEQEKVMTEEAIPAAGGGGVPTICCFLYSQHRLFCLYLTAWCSESCGVTFV